MANGLPEGFTLDQPAQPQGLPEGFTLDQSQQPTQEQQSIISQSEARIQTLQADLDKLNQVRNNPDTLEQVFGGVEGFLALASAPVAAVASGIAGLADAVNPFAEEGAGAARQKQVQEDLTFTPRLPSGQGAVENVANVVEGATELGTGAVALTTAGIEGAITGDPIQSARTFQDITKRGVGEVIGSTVAEKTDSPLLGSIARVIPEAAGLAAGFFKPSSMTSKFGKNISEKKQFKDLSPKQKQRLIAEEIKTGNPNIDSVTKFINEKGNLATSKASSTALKSKFLGNENQTAKTVSIFERADNATKKGIGRMLDSIVKGRNEPKFLGRASDEVGQSIINRVQEVSKVKESAGKQIGAVAKSLKNKQVDISEARTQFFDKMNDLGVKFKTGEDGFVTADFSRSKFIGGSQKDMNVLVNDLLKDNVGFEFAHELKQTIREGLNIDKGGATGIGKGRSQKIMTDLASDIDKVLDGVSPQYDAANIRFSKTVEIVEIFQKAAGKDVDLFSDTAALMLANKAKRITSNAGSGVTFRKDIAKIDEILKDLDITFKDDVQSLLIASDDLERIFDLAKANSFKGNIIDASRKASRGDIPLEEIAGFVKKVFSPSETKVFNQKIKVLRDLVKVKGKKQ